MRDCNVFTMCTSFFFAREDRTNDEVCFFSFLCSCLIPFVFRKLGKERDGVRASVRVLLFTLVRTRFTIKKKEKTIEKCFSSD